MLLRSYGLSRKKSGESSRNYVRGALESDYGMNELLGNFEDRFTAPGPNPAADPQLSKYPTRHGNANPTPELPDRPELKK